MMTKRRSLYAPGQLQGATLDWWDSFCFVHTKANCITWPEFRSAFRSHHVPAGLMKLKKKEFLALKQGSMSIAEYHDKFIKLSWYAPTEVEDDKKRHELLMEGLNDGL